MTPTPELSSPWQWRPLFSPRVSKLHRLQPSHREPCLCLLLSSSPELLASYLIPAPRPSRIHARKVSSCSISAFFVCFSRESMVYSSFQELRDMVFLPRCSEYRLRFGQVLKFFVWSLRFVMHVRCLLKCLWAWSLCSAGFMLHEGAANALPLNHITVSVYQLAFFALLAS